MLELLDTEYKITISNMFKGIKVKTQNINKEHETLEIDEKIFNGSKQNFKKSKIKLIKISRDTGVIAGQLHLKRQFENCKKDTKKFRIYPRDEGFEIEI